MELGGGDYMDKIAPVRARLAKLAKAAEAEPAELYNIMYHHMELLHLSAEDAYKALEVAYAMGKKGAYELKTWRRAFQNWKPSRKVITATTKTRGA